MAVQRVLLGSPETLLTRTGLGGFPASFPYFLCSWWACLTAPGIINLSNPICFGSVNINQGNVGIEFRVALQRVFSGIYAVTSLGTLTNLLVSASMPDQIVQVYVNDVPLARSSGPGWERTASAWSLDTFPQWQVLDSGSAAPGVGVGDLFATAPTSLVDLAVVANRRKFINADLTPVSLGADGSAPLGTQPPIFLTLPSGDTNAADFALNAGGGGVFTITGIPLTIQPPGACGSGSDPLQPSCAALWTRNTIPPFVRVF